MKKIHTLVQEQCMSSSVMSTIGEMKLYVYLIEIIYRNVSFNATINTKNFFFVLVDKYLVCFIC